MPGTSGSGGVTRALVPTLCPAGCVTSRPAAQPEPAPLCRCTPGKPCWPTRDDWQKFAASLRGKLEQSQSPLAPCRSDAAGEACATAIRNSTNPFYLQDQPGGTESTGWLGAWTAASSAYAVVAKDASDVVAAVKFARRSRLRLVIKGTGHDYLGRSNAPDSLLVWTHQMRKVDVRDAFIPHGCGAAEPAPAVPLGAGPRGLEARQERTVKPGRYVQVCGGAPVGAAGGLLYGR